MVQATWDHCRAPTAAFQSVTHMHDQPLGWGVEAVERLAVFVARQSIPGAASPLCLPLWKEHKTGLRLCVRLLRFERLLHCKANLGVIAPFDEVAPQRFVQDLLPIHAVRVQAAVTEEVLVLQQPLAEFRVGDLRP